jgi:hypothetical protein
VWLYSSTDGRLSGNFEICFSWRDILTLAACPEWKRLPQNSEMNCYRMIARYVLRKFLRV